MSYLFTSLDRNNKPICYLAKMKSLIVVLVSRGRKSVLKLIVLGFFKKEKKKDPQRTLWRQTRTGSTGPPPAPAAPWSGSGGDHAFVPLPVRHGAPVVVADAALIGLLLASVQERLRGLSLAFGPTHHVTGPLGPKPGGNREGRRRGSESCNHKPSAGSSRDYNSG